MAFRSDNDGLVAFSPAIFDRDPQHRRTLRVLANRHLAEIAAAHSTALITTKKLVSAKRTRNPGG